MLLSIDAALEGTSTAWQSPGHPRSDHVRRVGVADGRFERRAGAIRRIGTNTARPLVDDALPHQGASDADCDVVVLGVSAVPSSACTPLCRMPELPREIRVRVRRVARWTQPCPPNPAISASLSIAGE
jgi:hypothetical protein